MWALHTHKGNMNNILLFLLLTISTNAFASIQVLRWPGNTPSQVCQPSDTNPSCGGGGSGGSGNVGIGTANRFAGYLADGTTVAPFQTVEVNGNVGIATLSPSATLHIGRNPLNNLGFEIASTMPAASVFPSYTGSLNTIAIVGEFGASEFWNAQQFTLVSAANITGLSLSYANSNGSPVGTNTISIQTNTSSCGGPASCPSGTLANANLTGAITPVTSSPFNVNSISYTSTNLSSGTYWIVIKPTTTQASNVYWQIQGSTTQSMNASTSNGGSTWSSNAQGNYYSLSGGYVTGTQYTVIDSNGNVGINTVSPQGALIVTNGNVGLGSLAPGQQLDVTGTVRTTGLTLTGNGAASGYVLTSSDGAGDATWSNPGSVSGWTISGNNIYETNLTGNVGIGTTIPPDNLYVVGSGQFTGQLKLSTSGGLSIGTSAVLIGTTGTGNTIVTGSSPSISNAIMTGAVRGGTTNTILTMEGTSGASPTTASAVLIQNTASTGSKVGFSNDNLSNVGIGTKGPNSSAFTVWGGGTFGGLTADSYNQAVVPAGGLVVENNVGIGTWLPAQKLDVIGTVRTTNFTMSGQTPVTGYILTATDSAGDAIWTAPTSGSGTVNSGVANQVAYYATTGTTLSGNAAFVFNGTNVGIGTVTPTNALDVVGGVGIAASGSSLFATSSPPAGSLQVEGNIGIGTVFMQTSALTVMNGNVGIGTWKPTALFNVIGGNVSIGTTTSAQLLTIGTASQVTFTNAGGMTTTASIAANGGITSSSAAVLTGSASTTNITNNNATAGSLLMFIGGASTSSGLTFKSTNHAVTNANDFLRFQINNGTDALSIVDNNGNGNVGIGSSVPNATLDVEGTVSPVVFMAASTSNKNVGIGTFNPTALLNIGGSMYLDRVTSQIIMKDSGGGGGCTKITTNTGTVTGAIVACP